MATTKGSNTNKATANTKAAMSRSAANRQCPNCERKSAMKFVSDEYGFGSACRWCDYSTYRLRPT